MNKPRVYVILLHYTEFKITRELIESHVAYLRELEKEDRLVLCGPFAENKGGMVIIRAGSIDEAKAISERDPFVQLKARRPEVLTWHLANHENNYLI